LQFSLALNVQLGQVRQELQGAVVASGKIANDTQREVARRLESSTEAVRLVSQQLGEVLAAGRQLADAAHTFEAVLSGSKTRGALGEVALERLLIDSLPVQAFQMQYSFTTGAVVDAIVRVGQKIVSVDSKFPLESYRRLLDTGEDARREFAQAVKKHADSIASKYILPDQNTLDYALMFVPSENVYSEMNHTEDAKGIPLADYCRSIRVIPVSPSTLYAYLGVILMGLRGMQIEENAKRLLGSLSGLKKQLDDFAGFYETLGKHLRNAQQNYLEAQGKLERAQTALDQMAQGALPDAPVKALESSAKN